mgnify:FL=1
MVEIIRGDVKVFGVAQEDRALLRSTPSACRDAEADRAYPSRTGMRPCLWLTAALARKRKTSGFGAEPQYYIRSSSPTGGTYVTISGRGIRG